MNVAVVPELRQLTLENSGRVGKSRDDFLEGTLEETRISVSEPFRAKVQRHRSTQSSLGVMEHCEGIGRDHEPGPGGAECRRERFGLCLESGQSHGKKPLSTVVSERSPMASVQSGWGQPEARETAKGAVAKFWADGLEPKQRQPKKTIQVPSLIGLLPQQEAHYFTY